MIWVTRSCAPSQTPDRPLAGQRVRHPSHALHWCCHFHRAKWNLDKFVRAWRQSERDAALCASMLGAPAFLAESWAWGDQWRSPRSRLRDNFTSRSPKTPMRSNVRLRITSGLSVIRPESLASIHRTACLCHNQVNSERCGMTVWCHWQPLHLARLLAAPS